MEITKKIVKVGNSAGILVPRAWLNGVARVELVEKPISIKQDVIELLGEDLTDVLGIYLVGSYARGDETVESDVDVLVITNHVKKKIISGKYSILLVTKTDLEDALKNDVLPLLPMIYESKALLNLELLDKYKKIEINHKNLGWHISSTRKMLNMIKEEIEDSAGNALGDAVAYSLILRLRQVYMIDCIINGKKWGKKEFLGLLNSVSGSTEAYDG
ncbi:MAG: nucleotidyltransferase domain-containing protein, partial [archaeon]